MSFIGIDLGTTNSAVCSFDGENLHVHRSPTDQSPVTPSAIYLGPRGRFYGAQAYRQAVVDPGRTATGFKRLIGTATPIRLSAANVTMTPEECSAEILKVLFGYLPEEIRGPGPTGTVVTVPAAFNQMQRDATLAAAELAGIGRVALMQEPVAAVMTVLRHRQADGTFLVYDLGGGTFDVAIAQCTAGRVTLLGHGGIESCGGRDIDAQMVDRIVTPWLREHFDIPSVLEEWADAHKFRTVAKWAAERAKIELSSRSETAITVSEHELRARDRSGAELYLEVKVTRQELDEILAELIADTVRCAQEALASAHLTTADLERVVFIGGPTHYKPLRDKVASSLSLPADTQCDPMTAVAEGAALFAESVDWSSESRGRKQARGAVKSIGPLALEFVYIARTPDVISRVVVKSTAIGEGYDWQVDSLDIGWSSGRMPLKPGAAVDVNLPRYGENRFKVFVFHGSQGAVIQSDILTIARTPVAVDGIPASHSLGVAVKERRSGTSTKMRWLVRKGESLPKKGKETFLAGEALRAGGPGALVFKLYEGETEQPPDENRLVGSFKIEGRDFSRGVIQPGDELVCDYEVADSGRLSITVSAASVQGSFQPGHDFYSRQEGLIDYSAQSRYVVDECESLRSKAERLAGTVEDSRLDGLAKAVDQAQSQAVGSPDPETTKRASDAVIEAKRLLTLVKRDHLEAVRTAELDEEVESFEAVRDHAKASEESAYDNLTRSARRALAERTGEFDQLLSEMRRIRLTLLWRQDWWIVNFFETLSGQPHRFDDPALYGRLVQAGTDALRDDDMQRLREVVIGLWSKRRAIDPLDEVVDTVNIL